MPLVFDRDAVDEPLLYPAHTTPDLPLVRLLRLIFFRLKITLDDFANLYHTHGKTINMPPETIRARHNNDRRSISSPTKLTLYLFNRIVYNVLRMNVIRFEVVLEDPKTGQITIYRSDDPLDD